MISDRWGGVAWEWYLEEPRLAKEKADFYFACPQCVSLQAVGDTPRLPIEVTYWDLLEQIKGGLNGGTEYTGQYRYHDVIPVFSPMLTGGDDRKSRR